MHKPSVEKITFKHDNMCDALICTLIISSDPDKLYEDDFYFEVMIHNELLIASYNPHEIIISAFCNHVGESFRDDITNYFIKNKVKIPFAQDKDNYKTTGEPIFKDYVGLLHNDHIHMSLINDFTQDYEAKSNKINIDKSPGFYESINTLPGVKEKSKNPVGGEISSIKEIIISLNDTYKWTRDQIADWLETLDVDLRFKSPDDRLEEERQNQQKQLDEARQHEQSLKDKIADMHAAMNQLGQELLICKDSITKLVEALNVKD